MGSRIVATGRATPRTLITNHDLERRMDTSDEWIRTRTGIGQRYVISSGESLVEIAAKASQIALDRAGMKPADLEAIVSARSLRIMAFHLLPASCSIDLGSNRFPPSMLRRPARVLFMR